MHGRTASAAFDANDPLRKSWAKIAVMHNKDVFIDNVVGCDLAASKEGVDKFVACCGGVGGGTWPLAGRACAAARQCRRLALFDQQGSVAVG